MVTLAGHTARSEADAYNCPGWVRIEGWIVGDPAGATAYQSTHFARLGYPSDIGAAMLVPCPDATYAAHTKHWYIRNGWFGDPWFHIADLSAQQHAPNVCAPGGPGDPGHPPTQCNAEGECWDPILIDTQGNGIHLTNVADGVPFDLDGDGRPEQIAWTVPGSGNGWLVLDRNGNGLIDNGTELFTNFTPAYANSDTPTARNGFVALGFLENPTYGVSNGDGVIDARDSVFSLLRVWIDANHNGIAEPDELKTLQELGLVGLDTTHKEKQNKFDKHGNRLLHRGISWWLDEDGKVKRRYFYGVSLQQQ